MDYVSQLNLICQKNHLELPKYSYTGNFVCVAHWNDQKFESETFINKMQAKQDVACRIIEKFGTKEGITKTPGSILKTIKHEKILFIDGDQRSDVIKWLSLVDIPLNMKVFIFVSPISSTIIPDNLKKYVITSKST